MRTKTVALLAAAVVASALTASAQVYSVNVVGYVNTVVKPEFNLLANPLDNKNAGLNKVSNLIPSVPDGSFLYIYGDTGYTINNFDFGEWTLPDMSLDPGMGFWLQVPKGSPDQTLTFVGEVKQGPLETKLRVGFNLLGSQVPQAGKLSTELGYPADEGDFIYKYTPTGGYVIYNYEFAEWTPSEPVLGVGEGFWAEKVLKHAEWNRNFSVNP